MTDHLAKKNIPASKAVLRRTLRATRRALTADQHLNHSEQLAHRTLGTTLTLRFHNFALYLPADGEIDTWPLINKLLSLNLHVGLPALRKNSTGRLHMHFASYTETTSLTHGHYDLLEPSNRAGTHTKFLPDVLLLPLVGFDTHGHRLGMGGGFYDAYSNPLERIKPALRIGLAHEQQGLPTGKHLPVDPWDVPLDGVITEQRVISFSARGQRCLKPKHG